MNCRQEQEMKDKAALILYAVIKYTNKSPNEN